MNESGPLGAAMSRREDPPLLRGEATYTDDLDPPALLHAGFLRSPYAHARVGEISTGSASALEETVAIYTADDVLSTDVPGSVEIDGPLPHQSPTEYPLIAGDIVRYVGEPIAVVLSESRGGARRAANAIDVEFDRIGSVASVTDALVEDAPKVHGHQEDNRAFDWEFGNLGEVERAIDSADHVVELDLTNQRVFPDALEPRSVLAEYDADADTYEVVSATQSVFKAREWFTEILGIAEDRIRVTAPDVGGGFGSKTLPYTEDPLVVWCSAQVDRPVKWTATRSESHRSDHHGRDVQARGWLAFDENGRIEALRVDAGFNLGAYLVWSKTPATHFRHLLSGQYDIPAIAGHLTGAYTNTTPVAPYRGAGRPEAIYVVERLVNQAAAELGMDPAELRRRNLVEPESFPFESATGAVYDSGDYEGALDRALDRSDYRTRRAEQQDGRDEGRYLGIGLACVIENVGVQPGWAETARVVVHPSGQVTAYCGTLDHGQGHETTFSQLLSEQLGVDYDDITVVEGDTDDLPNGTGTFGSRSAAVGGSALHDASTKVIRRAIEAAARYFEVTPEDVRFRSGELHPVGAPDRSVGFGDIAGFARQEDIVGSDDDGLSATASYDPADFTYPFGSHVAVVDVDPETGDIDLLDYVAVDDCGVQFNPTVVEGQVHGGVVQGIGQALFEEAVYDDEGTLRNATLQDYAIPRSTQVPRITTDHTVTPCPHNPTGAKGVGECGTTAAPAAVVNAVVDALRPFGVDTIDMPLTEETVWRAVERAGTDR